MAPPIAVGAISSCYTIPPGMSQVLVLPTRSTSFDPLLTVIAFMSMAIVAIMMTSVSNLHGLRSNYRDDETTVGFWWLVGISQAIPP